MTDRMRAWRLLRRSLAPRDLVAGAGLAVLAEVSAAALLGVSGWFLTACALVTLQLNTVWSWMYPSGAVRALALLRTSLRYLERLTSHRTALAATVSLRSRLARGAARLTPRELRAEGAGSLLARLTTDVETVAGLPAQAIAPLAGSVVTALVVEALLLRAAPLLGVVELVVLGLGVAATLRAHARARRHRAAAETARHEVRTGLISTRGGLDDLRCLDAVPWARGRIAASLAQEEARAENAAAEERRARLALRLLAGVGQAAGLLLALEFGRAPQPVADALGELLLLVAAWELLDRLPAVLREAAAAHDAAERLTPLATTAAPGVPASPRTSGHRLTALDLPTPRDGATLSFTVHPPELVVVTGPNGSGKSTLLEQLAGRLGTASGEVLLGGASIEGLSSRTIAAQVTMVEAQDWLADTTVSANLCQAAPLADPDRLAAALAAVGLGRLPLDAVVGPAGAALSLGERRRLAIARALLRRPRFLLLDEPTEGLDPPTARALLLGIRAALPQTALVLAMQRQDLALLPSRADRIVDLSSGTDAGDEQAVGCGPRRAEEARQRVET